MVGLSSHAAHSPGTVLAKLQFYEFPRRHSQNTRRGREVVEMVVTAAPRQGECGDAAHTAQLVLNSVMLLMYVHAYVCIFICTYICTYVCMFAVPL